MLGVNSASLIVFWLYYDARVGRQLTTNQAQVVLRSCHEDFKRQERFNLAIRSEVINGNCGREPDAKSCDETSPRMLRRAAVLSRIYKADRQAQFGAMRRVVNL